MFKLPKTGRGMSEVESALFTDFIGGSYLLAGVLADFFVTPRTTQQVRRDKAKTREYHCRITVEQLAATQVQLRDLDLAAHKQKELRENLVGCGRGMIHRADKYLAQQHGRGCPGPQVQCLLLLWCQIGPPHWMPISQPESLQSLNMTLKRWIQESLRKTRRKTMPP